MGWASASWIFENVADSLVKSEATAEVKYEVCKSLIGSLLAEDWDTYDEVLDAYRNEPWILAAFRHHEIVIRCRDIDSVPGVGRYHCEMEIGHTGQHHEYWGEHSWGEREFEDDLK